MSLRRKVLLFLVLCAVTFAVAYGLWTAYRTARLYLQIKSAGRGWETPVNTSDPMLGYRPIPNMRSIEMFSCGYRVPVRSSPEGFRVPDDSDTPKLSLGVPPASLGVPPASLGVPPASLGVPPASLGVPPASLGMPPRRPLVLALGCSFTYGTACKAEEAYPYLVAQRLGGTALNAGVPGYGLAQMLLRARELMPQYKPDCVLVQYAPWLTERSVDYTSDWEAFGRTPRPYFACATPKLSLGAPPAGGGFVVEPPAFATNYFSLNMSPYVDQRANIREFATFLVDIGFRLWPFADVQMLRYRAKRALHLLPPLAADSKELIDAVYREIESLCRQNGAKLVIVVLGPGGIPPDAMPREYIQALRAIEGATVADAYGTLYSRLVNPTPDDYEKAYGIWACSPPRLIDRHPNPNAHRVIADAILGVMPPVTK